MKACRWDLASAVLGQAVLALGAHRFVALGWSSGLIGLALGTVPAADAVLKATMGLLVGAATSSATFTLLPRRSMRQFRPPTSPLA